jgi:dienelactone hydrolase
MVLARARRWILCPLVFVVLIFAASIVSAEVGASAPIHFTEKPVTFQVSSVTLAGTLLSPDEGVPHPAIVLLHGSGPGPRQELRIFAERFARLGFVTLIFDKRGSGESGGSWLEESLDDLADDVLAAASFLKEQANVDKTRVGVWGISQSGWVIPHAAARMPNAFAFAIVVTGGAVAPLEIEQHDYAAALDRLGVTGDDRRQALSLVDQYFEYLRSGKDRPALEAAIEAARGKPWFNAVNVGRVLPPDSVRAKWAWVPTYDPVPDISKMQMPVLVILGDKDRPSLSAKSLELWRTSLSSGGNPDGTVIDFLNAEHGAAMVGTHHAIHSGGPPTFVPGYLEIVDAWLSAHGTLPRANQ